MTLAACRVLKRTDKVYTSNMTTWVRRHTRSRKWGADPCPLFPDTIKGKIGRTSSIVRDKTWSEWVWRTCSFFSTCLVAFFLTCKCSRPIFTVKLFHKLQWEARVTTAIQFPYEQLPCRQGWQFIYFNLTDWENHAHQSSQPSHCIQGTSMGGGLMGLVHFTGIQLLWPKYANTFKAGPWPKKGVNHTLLSY